MKNRIFIILTFVVLIVSALAVSGQDMRPRSHIPEGYELIDGDILMPKGFFKALQANQIEATFRTTNLWPDGVVYFEYDANVSAANRTNMRNAMDVLTAVANIIFLECQPTCGGTSINNYAHVQSATGNSSQVGMVGGQQNINIVSWGSQFIIVHELLHCLGIYHEQSRPDRGTYVTVNCNNVQGGCDGTTFSNNFVIEGSPYGAYDFDSVMHYDQCAFSIDCPAGSSCGCTNTVITVLPPNQSQQTLIGQRTHLSTLDRAFISFLYRAPSWRFLDCGYGGGNGSSDGSVIRPYTSISAALAGTPLGGTLWISGPCSAFPNGTYLPFPINNNNVTFRTAPNIVATFGS